MSVVFVHLTIFQTLDNSSFNRQYTLNLSKPCEKKYIPKDIVKGKIKMKG